MILVNLIPSPLQLQRTDKTIVEIPAAQTAMQAVAIRYPLSGEDLSQIPPILFGDCPLDLQYDDTYLYCVTGFQKLAWPDRPAVYPVYPYTDTPLYDIHGVYLGQVRILC